MAEPAARSGAVLFDFDGTLVRGDCVAGFLRWQLRRWGWRKLAAIGAMPLLPLLAHWRTAWLPASTYAWLTTVGRSDSELEADRAAYIATLAAAPERWIIGPAVARLRSHLDRGEPVLIVTGAEQGMAERLWAALVPDLAGVPVLGSRMRRLAGGYVALRHNVGTRKLDTLRCQGWAPPFLVGYSDSSSDLAMLAASRRVVLVAPNARQRARIRRVLTVDEVLAPREG